jgi:hypothetical protein
MLKSNKRGLSEIVSITLLLLTAIIVFLSLQTWYFTYYESDVKSVVSENINDIQILKINSSSIFIKNPNSFNIEITEFYINENSCSISTTIESNSIVTLPTSSCSFTIPRGLFDVFIVTTTTTFLNTVIIEEQIN